MDFSLLLQNILNGLSIGSVYAIFALGYTLVFSILGIINFAHGAIFTLGAYFTYALVGGKFGFNGLLANAQLPFKLPFVMALLVGSVLSGLVTILLERLAFKPLRDKNADSLLTLVSSLGAALVIVNLIQYLVGAEIYTFPANIYGNLPAAINFGTATKPINIRTVQIIVFAVSVIIVACLTYLINCTKVGQALRAVAEHMAAHARRRRRSGDRTRPRRPALPRQGLGREPGVRLPQAVLPDHRQVGPGHGRRRRRRRRAHPQEGELLRRTDRQCPVTVQFRADEPGDSPGGGSSGLGSGSHRAGESEHPRTGLHGE